jgi:hypothetical protein
MAKIGRNDPCHCGSGKKYKQCHLPIEQAAQAEQRRLRRAVDTLMPQIIESAQEQTAEIPNAFARYWNNKYTADQLADLEDLEDRGAERFLTWFAFDYPLEGGKTLVEQLAEDEQKLLELTEEESSLLKQWTNVRLRPYVVKDALKGSHINVYDLLDNTEYQIEDHAASRHVEEGEVLIVHLLPAGDFFYIGGVTAHLTADTSEKLREFSDLHLQAISRDNPDATWIDLLRERSEILNHFVMQLPVEEPDPTVLDNIINNAKVSLQLAGESLGLGRRSNDDNDESEDKA